MPSNRFGWLCCVALISTRLFAATLSGNLSSAEVDKIIQTIGQGSATKLLRSAEPMEELFPGIKPGVEINMIFSGDLEGFGDAKGTVPGVILMPRLFIAKSLPFDLEFVFSLYPASFTGTVSSAGYLLKWSFLNERERYMAAAAYVSYTSITGFSSTYEGSSFEAGGLFSKDYVRFRPYVGLGMLFAHGQVSSALVRAGAINSAWQSTLHAFIGTEVPLQALDLTVQLDFMNLAPRASVLLGKRF